MNDFKLLHGDSRYTYITARPANVSFTVKRFSFQAGPVLSYLVAKKYSNTVVIFEKNTFDIIAAFFEQERKPPKILMGAHVNTRFSVGRRVGIMLGSQYFFNSVYKKNDATAALHGKSNALQMQFGVSYTVVRGSGK